MTCGLSGDVLRGVFGLLELPDLLNVHLASRQFHELSDALVYSAANLRWEDIDYISKQAAAAESDYRVRYFRKVSIAPSGRGEWNSSPNLSLLASESNFNLVQLRISCALRSSGWLKYVEHPLISIQRLDLVTAGPYVNYAFDFDHIAYNFPNLEFISLGDSVAGFVIDASPETCLPKLRHIRVQNCEWQYPARLAQVAAPGVLQDLEIYVTQHMHPFAFSERLQNEIATLPPSLQSLTVWLDVGKRISWNPLQKAGGLPLLTTAKLHGFDYKYRAGLENLKFPSLRTLIEN